MPKLTVAVLVVLSVLPVTAAVTVQNPLANDITATDIKSFVDTLPRDRVNDRSIRVVDVGDYRFGVYGVFRQKAFPGGANLHRVRTTEIYYILEGAANLITGGTFVNQTESPTNITSLRGSAISGGASRRVTAGDVVVIPGHTAHWFSELETDISYLIFHPDPDSRLTLR